MGDICQNWSRDAFCIVVDGHLPVFGHRNEYDPKPRAGFKRPYPLEKMRNGSKTTRLRYRSAGSQIETKNPSLGGQAEI